MDDRFRSKERERANVRSREKSEEKSAQAGECTFCGAPIGPGESECDECGMPVGGIECPVCGALSRHSFCEKCGSPLNRAARVALEKARQDPSFQKVRELVEKAVKLKEKLSGTEAAPGEGTMEFLKMFSSDVAFTESSDESARQEYLQTVTDIEKLFAQMLPPAGSTPQQQMNYYCARNIAVTTVVQDEIRIKSPVEWICNYCGCHHTQPSECCKPFLGGTWVYEDKVVQERIIKKEIKSEE